MWEDSFTGRPQVVKFHTPPNASNADRWSLAQLSEVCKCLSYLITTHDEPQSGEFHWKLKPHRSVRLFTRL